MTSGLRRDIFASASSSSAASPQTCHPGWKANSALSTRRIRSSLSARNIRTLGMDLSWKQCELRVQQAAHYARFLIKWEYLRHFIQRSWCEFALALTEFTYLVTSGMLDKQGRPL